MDKKVIKEYFEKNKDQMLKDICELIKIKSPKGEAKDGKPFGEGPAAALEAGLKLAENMGFAVKNYDNYVGTVDFAPEKEKALDMLAHLDVVPASDEWTVTQPYEPVIKDGKLYGRGSSDDKGPAVAALYAMKAVKDLNIPISKNVRLILGTDEECGSSDIAYYYKFEEEAPMTFSPDAEFPLINIEKGRFAPSFTQTFGPDDSMSQILCVKGGVKENVVPDRAEALVKGLPIDVINTAVKNNEKTTGVSFTVESDGDDRYLIKSRGTGAHASTPENGNNALTALIQLLAQLPVANTERSRAIKHINELFPHNDHEGKALGAAMEDKESGKLSLAFTMFEFDEYSLKGTFDSRAPICADDENLVEKVRENLKAKGFTLGNEKSDKLDPAHHVSGDSEFIKTLLKCYEEFSGLKGECLAIGGGTYVHHLKNGVAFGCSLPGTDNHMHGDDEFAVVDELILSAEIFTAAIAELCK